MLINLTSDTVTKPSKAMLEFMMQAEVGDDVFRTDPSVNNLESYTVDMFGMEAALFCPSGTMANQIAIKAHTNALDEMICHKLSHVYLYELGGYAFNSGIAVELLDGPHGKITADQIKKVIKPEADWLPNSKLVVLENTANKAGGSYYNLDEIKPISKLCKEENLALHLDGARLFNALVETGESTKDVGAEFDSISICISKGLGAPVGSVLIGKKTFIAKARKLRKMMGGGMRQAGYLAAACQYALMHNIERLKEDHERAQAIGTILEQLPFVHNIRPIQSNIIIFDVKNKYTGDQFVEALKSQNIHTAKMGVDTIRFVFHLDIKEEMVSRLKEVLYAL